jgi:hypothetical protein
LFQFDAHMVMFFYKYERLYVSILNNMRKILKRGMKSGFFQLKTIKLIIFLLYNINIKVDEIKNNYYFIYS